VFAPVKSIANVTEVVNASVALPPISGKFGKTLPAIVVPLTPRVNDKLVFGEVAAADHRALQTDAGLVEDQS
jgi:hypothetical protein